MRFCCGFLPCFSSCLRSGFGPHGQSCRSSIRCHFWAPGRIIRRRLNPSASRSKDIRARNSSISRPASGKVSRVHILAAGICRAMESPRIGQARNSRDRCSASGGRTETVVVTAHRTPVPNDESGAAINTLSGAQLDTMRPGCMPAMPLRFLPGAIVDAAGQRGGLASLFVRWRRFALQQSNRRWRQHHRSWRDF